MAKKKYYKITTSMTFEETVLVPVDSVENLDEAIDLVDAAVEIADICLLNEEPECKTVPSEYADENGICEFDEEYAESYQIIGD